jgi:hypothetical protein
MNYFNQILDGNIPLSIIDSVNGYQQDYRNLKAYSYYQINESMTDIGIDKDLLLKSSLGNHINISMTLNRTIILQGIKNMLINISKQIMQNNSVYKKNDTYILMSKDFSKSVGELINNMNIDNDLNKKIMLILDISGITNKNNSDIEDSKKELSLLLELTPTFDTDYQIFLSDLLKEQLNKCSKNFIYDCIFNDTFINSLTNNLIMVFENIFTNILNSSKIDKLPTNYALSVDFSKIISTIPATISATTIPSSIPATTIPSTIPSSTIPTTIPSTIPSSTIPTTIPESIPESIPAQNIVEGFAVSAGNKTTIQNTTIGKDLSDIEKNIDQSKMISGMASIVSSAITSAVSNNQSDLLRTISVSNSINIGSAQGTSFTLSNITQTSTIDQTTNANFVQTITNKVVSDITNTIIDNIKTATKQNSNNIQKLQDTLAKGTDVGSTITGAVGSLAQAGADILSASAKNSLSDITTTDMSKQLIDKYNLNQSFNYQKNNNAQNAISNALSSSNLSKCAADSQSANSINIASINVTGPIEIDGLTQTQVVRDVMNCAFNQAVVNDIATNLVTTYNTLIDELIENVNSNLSDTQKIQTVGDIYAMGVAGKQVLEGAGTGLASVAVGAGTGLSSAATGAGTGLATAAVGAGQAASTIASGMMMPLVIILGICIVLAGIYFAISKGSSDSGGSGGSE